MKNTVKNVGEVLRTPSKTFSGEDYLKSRRILLILFLYLCFAGAGLLSMQAQRTDTFREIQYNTAIEAVENQMAGATEDQMELARETIREQLGSKTTQIIQTVSVVVFSWFGMLYILLVWAIVIILSRMLGGEETPYQEKKHRRTFYLCLYSGIPVAISGLIAGILIIAKNPASYANVLTLGDYMLEMQVTPSLYYVLRPDSFNPGLFPTYLLTTLTDPFAWWSFAILFYGIRALLRLGPGKTSLIIALSVLAQTGLTVLIKLPAQIMGS